jgi:CheY-specific phosphatase CheX
MTGTDIRPCMEDAVSEVLEAMCFISSEGQTDDEEGNYQSDWICGELSFAGPTSGSFGIAVSPATAAVMAANFLGEEESLLSKEQTLEVVCEMANMICGALLSHYDPKNAFTLSPPRHDRSGLTNSAGAPRTSGTYRLDEGFIHSWVEIREDA